MYTTYMTALLQTILASESGKTDIVVDWSANADAESSALISWIQNSPAKNRVHVFLPSRFHPDMRTLQNTLQSMGCTVTRRALAKN